MDTTLATSAGSVPGGLPDLAVLLDFENLVYGLANSPAGIDAGALLDIDAILDYAQTLGAVSVLRAYGDWRHRELNRYLNALERAGFETVQVFSRVAGSVRKNATDVRLAIDAVEMVWTLPHVKTFLIASGDRDFVHVIQTLRRHGRRVHCVAIDGTQSSQVVAASNGFRSYSQLLGRAPAVAPARVAAKGLELVARTLVALVVNEPGGMLGSPLKAALLRAIPGFSEADFGFVNFKDFLRAFQDLVLVQTAVGPGDLRVLCARTPMAERLRVDPEVLNWQREALQRSRLQGRMVADPVVRRTLLARAYALLGEGAALSFEEFTELFARSPVIPYPVVRTFHALLWRALWYGRAFQVDPGTATAPPRHRRMQLDPRIRSAQDLLLAYERTACLRMIRRLGAGVEPTVLFALLGLDPRREEDRQHVAAVLTSIQERAEEFGLESAPPPAQAG